MNGKILAIFVAADKGLPMQYTQQVEAVRGVGLLGDRYATGKGAWSGVRVGEAIRHVSFIENEAVATIVNNGLALTPKLTRRNILTEGVQLNELVGKIFRIGSDGPIFRGAELCTPCGRPGKLSGVPDLKKQLENALEGRGGLRAEIIKGGMIAVGDVIIIEE